MMGLMDADGTHSSSTVITVDLIGTAVFVVTAVLAAAIFTDAVKVVAVVVSLVLSGGGVCAFLLSYWTAVQRSRADSIAVAQLYFLTGSSTPTAIKLRMNGALLLQVVVGLATAIARNSTDGRAGSTLAFGILWAMFGPR